MPTTIKIKATGDEKCDWDGQYGKDEFDNLFFWCIHCGKKRGLEELGKIKCEDK